MHDQSIADNRPESTEKLNADPIYLAAVFGRRAIEQIKTGRDPYQAAKLAGSYGCRALNDRAVS
jgi:hypothetical protein